MNPSDMITLLQITKSKIDKGATFEDIEKFIVDIHGNEIMSQVESDINEYLNLKNKSREKNKKFWMLVCNPMYWGDEEGEFKVNELLKNLHKQEDGEWWKINDKTNMELKMKIGHKGIIKVSEDTRNDNYRTDNDGEIVSLLDSGIYGVFEITNDNECDSVYQFDNGDWYVHIKMIDNYFDYALNISKEKSRELIGETIYNSQSSRELDKVLFDRVANYSEDIRTKDEK